MRLLVTALALAACKPAPVPPGPVETLRLGGMRALAQHVGGARKGDKVPLLLSLHAMGSDPAYFLELFKSLKVPARVVAPCGRELGGACDWFDLNDPQGPRAAAARVLRAVEELRAQEPIRGKPVVMGFSQGAVLAFFLAAEHPEAIAAAFPVAGNLPSMTSHPLPAQLPPVHAFLGTADPVFPLPAVQGAVDALRAEGFAADLRTYPGVAHELSDGEAADLRAAIEAALR